MWGGAGDDLIVRAYGLLGGSNLIWCTGTKAVSHISVDPK